MTKKTREFELMGQLVGHPDYKDAKPGDVLKLEVGDDNLPSSDLLRSRVRPLGERLEAEGAGMTEKEAKGKAKEIIDEAKAKAAEILKQANEDATAITDKANADAAALLEDLKK